MIEGGLLFLKKTPRRIFTGLRGGFLLPFEFYRTAIIGIIAGFIACKLTNREGKGCIIDLLLGIVGGAVGGWLFGILGIHAGAGIIGEIITAVVGAVVVLWLWNKLS